MSADLNPLDAMCALLDGSDRADEYAARHNIDAATILTIVDDDRADLTARYLAERVRDKVVVEIGGGIGLLACHLGHIAKRVFVIEACPAWTLAHLAWVYKTKPKNVSFLFGAADEFAGLIKADVALFCTHSGQDSMRLAAALFAPVVIDVYEEILPGEAMRVRAEAERAILGK